MRLKCLCYYLTYICFLLYFIFTASFVQAQDSTLTYAASILVSGTTGQTPFWFHANQHGAIPADGSFVSGQWGIYKIYNPNNPRVFQWSGGVEAVTNYNKSGDVFFTDLYGAAKIGPIEFFAGQKKNITGLIDTTLTSGSLAVAGNSRPFPRIQISVPEFYPLPLTNDIVSFKASYSDGNLGGSNIIYGSTRYVPKTYFHQKSLYLRFGKNAGRLLIYTGFNHQVIWGGEQKISPISGLRPIDAYWYAITGKTLNYKKIGNHFGTVDLSASWKGKNWTYIIYRQNIYENGSLFKIINFVDGLNGLAIKRNRPIPKSISKFAFQTALIELIGTKDQKNSPAPFGLSIFEYGNYFNHYIYQNGWSYRGEGIGTPLIPSKELTSKNLPQNVSQFSNNNRIWALHAGMKGRWQRIDFTAKGTFSLNYGTYLAPFSQARRQTSVFLSAERKVSLFKEFKLLAGFTTDLGSLYPHSSGIMIGVRKNGFLN